MTLEGWHTNHWLEQHDTSAEEIADLFAVVDRDIKDAQVPDLSADWRASIAYNAALQLATAALAAAGYRPSKSRAHERTILSLQYTVGVDRSVTESLDGFRRKRNLNTYDRTGAVSDNEAAEILELATELRQSVTQWLAANHPTLVPG